MKRFPKLAALSASALLLANQAFAAVPADVTASITEAKSDALTVAGAVLGIVFALLAFTYMRRQAK